MKTVYVKRPPEFPHVQVDVNYWKTFVHTGLATAAGDRGAITLFGKKGVSCMWGLEAMRYLVRDKHLTPARADHVATRMVEANPLLADEILQRFRKQIGR